VVGFDVVGVFLDDPMASIACFSAAGVVGFFVIDKNGCFIELNGPFVDPVGLSQPNPLDPE